MRRRFRTGTADVEIPALRIRGYITMPAPVPGRPCETTVMYVTGVVTGLANTPLADVVLTRVDAV